ncbi:unnamed protein product [Ascophyllum nodosum]
MGVGASVSPPPTAPTEDHVSASPASEDAQAAANAAGYGVTAMTCLPEDGVGQQETALAGEATRASTGGSAGGGGRAEGRVGGKKKVGGGGKAKAKAIARKSSRLAFSDLKHDVREERMYRANAGLSVAFEALAAMLLKAPSGDEAVYRSLISACGRSGNSEKAMVVVELMMSTGIVPDAMVSRCLVDAFAMDDSFLDGRAHPLALLDWSKFRPTHRDERRYDNSRSAEKGETSFSLKRILKRFENSAAGERSAASPVTPGTPVPAASPAAIAAAAAATGGLGSGVVTPLSPVRPSSYGSITGIGLSISPPNTGDTEGSRGVPSRSDARVSPALPQSSGRFSFAEGGPSWASVGQPSCPDTGRAFVRRRSFEVSDARYRYSSGAGGATESARKTPEVDHNVKHRMSPDSSVPQRPRQVPEGGAPSPYAMNGGMSLAMHQEIVLGERLLEQLFPDLKIDNVGETCPSCLSNLSPRQVRQGWSPDPNDYTTECLAHIDLSTAKAVASGSSAVAATRGTTAKPSEGEKGAASQGARRTPIQKPVVKCGRRFVSRFSVHSAARGWEGTTGPGTPLWCEYLSPWVLRKEFHNILAWFGVRYLCSARFREGLGPAAEAAGEEIRRLSGTSLAAGGGGSEVGPRPVDRTIFWNLVVHFREASLPLAFLLQDAAFGGSSAVLL